MENSLRYSFVPKFEIKNNGVRKVFICDNAYGLNNLILNQVTNSLGWDKIRKSNKTNITSEELKSHLKEMDETTNEFNRSLYFAAIEGLINSVETYREFSHELANKVENLHKTAMEELPAKNNLLESYKIQLEEKDAEIEKLKRKSLLSRIFG